MPSTETSKLSKAKFPLLLVAEWHPTQLLLKIGAIDSS
jgi:hypothetical protein